jgi:hypothetical protein
VRFLSSLLFSFLLSAIANALARSCLFVGAFVVEEETEEERP